MADLQIGNTVGVAQRGNSGGVNAQDKIADITAEGVNTFTVSAGDLPKITVGSVIDVSNKTTSAVVASARTITNVTSAGVCTYDGADAATTTSCGVYPTGKTTPAGRTNTNGGQDDSTGYTLRGGGKSISEMRTRLTTINSSYYTAAMLNRMTYNDMVYALRVSDAPAGI